MKKLLYGLILRSKTLFISVKQVNEVHLMDSVIYDGKKCFVNNGVSAPIWDLCEEELKSDGIRNTYRVHEKDFKKAKTFRNLKNDLFYHYDWYMRCWYKIDLRKMCKE